MLKKAKVGVRLRRFREERGLTQAALASALGISASYVNQMESNQRALTVPVLMRLAEVFDIDVTQFSTAEADRLTAELRDVFTDGAIGESISLAETRELAGAMPAGAPPIVFAGLVFSGAGPGARAADASLARIDAHRRFHAAVEHVGPGLADICWRVICAGEGIGGAEKALGWPSRAGKLVLTLALDRLTRFYGTG